MQNSLIFFLVLSLFSYLVPPPLSANILGVKSDGSGDYLTINEAILAAQEGDLVLIGPGTYREPIEINKINDLTLAGSGADVTRIEITGNFCLSIENSTNISIEDISFFTRSDMGDSTIYIDNSSVELSYCVVESSPDAYGIYLTTGSLARIIHNTILHHKKEGAIRFDSSCDMVIKSNILMGNSFGINNVSQQPTSYDISHNLLFKNGVDYHNSKKGPGDITLKPQFLDKNNKNYRLKPSSPCIGAAHDGSEIGAFPLKKRTRRIKPKIIIPPELYLEGMIIEPGEDGFLNGGEQAHIKAVISNIGEGPAYNITINYHSTSTFLGKGRKMIKKLAPHAKKEISFPLSIPGDISDEEITITLQAVDKDGFEAEPFSLDATLLSTEGQLIIETDPDQAQIYVDDTLRGETPLSLDKLSPGSYRIRITLENHEEINETITIESRAELTRQFVLLKLKGDLYLESDPPGAKITFQEQARMDRTPLKIEYIDVGTYEIAAEKYTPDLIYRFNGQVEIKEGENRMRIERFTTEKVPPGMVLIPEGEFEMGSDTGETNENPAHKIYLNNYYIDKTAVSWGEYIKFVRDQKRPKPFYADDLRFSGKDRPAVGITFEEAQQFAKWAGKRLPTEAEWEKAAHSEKNFVYPWGNEFSPDKANAVSDNDGHKFTAPVNSFPNGASPYGVLNMGGNVWEWCSDFYNATYYYVSPPRNPKGPKNEKRHVLRGGAWNESRYDVRTTRRWSYWPDLQRNYIGLRLVFSAD